MEENLLETGGGLKKAAFFLQNSEPFFLHNVDVVSTIDLNKMMDQHTRSGSLVTLAVKKRKTSRYLLFDEKDRLCGWKSVKENHTMLRRDPAGRIAELGFCGIHVISPEIFAKITETGRFSIIQTYLRLIEEGEKICAFHADPYQWQDFGKPDQIYNIG